MKSWRFEVWAVRSHGQEYDGFITVPCDVIPSYIEAFNVAYECVSNAILKPPVFVLKSGWSNLPSKVL